MVRCWDGIIYPAALPGEIIGVFWWESCWYRSDVAPLAMSHTLGWSLAAAFEGHSRTRLGLPGRWNVFLTRGFWSFGPLTHVKKTFWASRFCYNLGVWSILDPIRLHFYDHPTAAGRVQCQHVTAPSECRSSSCQLGWAAWGCTWRRPDVGWWWFRWMIFLKLLQLNISGILVGRLKRLVRFLLTNSRRRRVFCNVEVLWWAGKVWRSNWCMGQIIWGMWVSCLHSACGVIFQVSIHII